MKRLLRKLLGDRGEQAAARYLRQHGYRILQRGYRNPFGEVDLIALFERRIIFIEVKTRSSDRTGQPGEAVDLRKQRKLTRLAMHWLRTHNRLEQAARFDVISIFWRDDGPQIQHIPNAFDAVE